MSIINKNWRLSIVTNFKAELGKVEQASEPGEEPVDGSQQAEEGDQVRSDVQDERYRGRHPDESGLDEVSVLALKNSVVVLD